MTLTQFGTTWADVQLNCPGTKMLVWFWKRPPPEQPELEARGFRYGDTKPTTIYTASGGGPQTSALCESLVSMLEQLTSKERSTNGRYAVYNSAQFHTHLRTVARNHIGQHPGVVQLQNDVAAWNEAALHRIESYKEGMTGENEILNADWTFGSPFEGRIARKEATPLAAWNSASNSA